MEVLCNYTLCLILFNLGYVKNKDVNPLRRIMIKMEEKQFEEMRLTIKVKMSGLNSMFLIKG